MSNTPRTLGTVHNYIFTDTLKELWVSELLPEHRKLKSLQQRPLNLLLPSPNSRRPSSQSSRESQSSKGARSWQCRLLLWFCEDHIKSRYLQFVTVLQVHNLCVHVQQLLTGHPTCRLMVEYTIQATLHVGLWWNMQV